MATAKLEREYQAILEQRRRKGEIEDEDKGADRRVHPRLKVNSMDLWLNAEAQLSVIDMSASGISFISNHPLKPGESINIALGKVLNVDAKVLACHLEESATEFLDAQFRIQCKFGEEASGMELLVRTVKPT
jgi:hypothetical protein